MLPALPQSRPIDGPVGNSLSEIRNFLSVLTKNVPFLNGTEVVATFTPAEVAAFTFKRITTGLGWPVKGFFIMSGHSINDLQQQALPSTELDRTTLYLRATASGTYNIWVF
jgi:hypothetical protein